MTTILKSALISAVALMLACCTSAPEEETEISRLDIELRDMAGVDTPSVSDKNLPGARLMFRAMGYDTITPELLAWWSNSDAVRVFQPDVDSVYTDLTPLSRGISAVTARARKAGLGLPDMKYYTIVWGNPRPLLRDSDVMIIALNHYLGAEYPGYSHWEQYRRQDKTPGMMPYDIAAALVATQFPFARPQDATLIDWMLYEGALVEARMRLVDDADLAAALGFTSEQLEWCDDNYSDMMRELSARRKLYDTDPVLIDRMLAPAPAAPLMAGRAPGRVGRYIGYRMIKDYLREHPSATIPQLTALRAGDVISVSDR